MAGSAWITQNNFIVSLKIGTGKDFGSFPVLFYGALQSKTESFG